MTQLESHSPRRARQTVGPPQPQIPPRTGTRPPTQRPTPRDPRRGSHATPLGQGFSWVVGWTIAGAVVPGAGLLAAGWRKLGGLLLGVLVLAGAALGAAVVVGDGLNRIVSFAVDPQKLLIAAVAAVAVALLWIAVILLTSSELRRYATLTRAQRGFSTLVVLALIAAVALPAYKASSYALIQRDLITSVFSTTDNDGPAPDAKAADPWVNVPRVNVLLVGSDAGPTRQGVRPDTLIMASIDTRSGDTVLFSLPRNLERVPFPLGSPGAQAWPEGFSCPGGECLLNAVWTWAQSVSEQYFPNDPNPGLTATEQAVEGILGLKVHYYSMVNLKGFEQFVDAIGGVRVDVNERLPIGGDSQNRVAEYGYIEPGKNKKLDGFNALWFARSRWSTDDFDRMRRQRCVIGAVAEQADPAKMAVAFPKIAAAAKDNLATDIPQRDLEAWVTLSLRIQKAKVKSLAFTDEVIPDRTDPDYPAIRELVTKAITAKPKAQQGAGTGGAGSGTTPGTPAPGPSKAPADPTEAQDVKEVC